MIKMKDLGLKLSRDGQVLRIDEKDRDEYTNLPKRSEETTIDRPKSVADDTPQTPPPPPPRPPIVKVDASVLTSLPDITLPPPPAPPEPKPKAETLATQVEGGITKKDEWVYAEGYPPGFGEPEPLTGSQESEYSLAIDVYGVFVVRCLMSRQFKLREWALAQ
ncbi:hypothetical protein HK102_012761, partial [Quaeritorhiza haematococci]